MSEPTEASAPSKEKEDVAEIETSASSEESLQWLRDHGVTVETPEDRVSIKKAAVSLQSLKASDPNTRVFKYVKIPAAMDEPIELLTGVVPSDHTGVGDKLPALLSVAFGSGKVDDVALKTSSLQELAGGLGEFSLSSLTPESIAASGGSAEPFRLSDNVTLYLDAVGALKRLPINPRAADLAARCGYGSGVPFHGDIFIGRLDHSADPGPRNIDLVLDDVRGDASWIRSAAEQNAAHQAVDGRTGGMSAEELTNIGGDGEGYTWSQDPEELEVTVAVPAGTKSKAVKAQFAVSSLKVAVEGGTTVEIVLFGRVVPDGCSWSLSDGNVVITLEKGAEGETWPTLTRDM
eukprot:m.26175 g.26175  ORF g.26175 m.26175 type:complete len:348 (+) comp11679_c0_seq1:191-1234(+)